jgi:hypothetical protein
MVPILHSNDTVVTRTFKPTAGVQISKQGKGARDDGLHTTVTHRAPLRLAFPTDVFERWFPNLYPANAGSRS